MLALFLVRVTVVTLLNPKRGKFNVTEKGGVLRIPVLPPGDYRVRLEKPGFQAVSVDRTQVLAQRETRLNLRLSPMSVVVIESVLLVSQAPAGTRVRVVRVEGANLTVAAA